MEWTFNNVHYPDYKQILLNCSFKLRARVNLTNEYAPAIELDFEM